VKWIKHMTATRRDEKIARLIAKHGMAAYGLYWSIQEIIAEQMEGPEPSCSVSYPVSIWAHQLSMYAPQAEKQLQWMADAGLMEVQRIGDEIVVTNRNLLKYRDEYSRKSGHTPDKLPSKSGREGEGEGDTDKDIKQKPSRAKARATKTAVADERHMTFKAAIQTYWESKNTGVAMPWGPMEGKQLGMWLREAPHITLDQFTGFLRARFRSDVNHSDRPSQWIRWVTSYGSGPIDRFGKPIQENGNATLRPSPTHQRIEGNRAALAAALARRGINPTCITGSPDVRALPEPGSSGQHGGLLVGFRAAIPEMLSPTGNGGAGEASDQARAELHAKAR
jgi:hypothetical protein